MSKTLSKEEVLFRQRFLSCCGFYKDDLEGLWGKNTDQADKDFFIRSAAIAAAEGPFDPRSERNILSLQCDAQVAARRALAAIRSDGTDARIISGTRTYPEQQALFRQGRFGNKGPRVTNAQAGQSWHNFGLAWDIGIFKAGVYVANDDKPYKTVSGRGKVTDVEWGGDWKTFKDFPHYQFGTEGKGVTGARKVFEAGGRP
jgi:peptidoglycan LD-endopeptidase CwlK